MPHNCPNCGYGDNPPNADACEIKWCGYLFSANHESATHLLPAKTHGAEITPVENIVLTSDSKQCTRSKGWKCSVCGSMNQVMQSVGACGSSSSMTDPVINTITPSLEGIGEASDRWTCAACTAQNIASVITCVVCENAKITPGGTSKGVNGDRIVCLHDGHGAARSERWQCVACTTINRPTSTVCVVCKQSRHNSVARTGTHASTHPSQASCPAASPSKSQMRNCAPHPFAFVNNALNNALWPDEASNKPALPHNSTFDFRGAFYSDWVARPIDSTTVDGPAVRSGLAARYALAGTNHHINVAEGIGEMCMATFSLDDRWLEPFRRLGGRVPAPPSPQQDQPYQPQSNATQCGGLTEGGSGLASHLPVVPPATPFRITLIRSRSVDHRGPVLVQEESPGVVSVYPRLGLDVKRRSNAATDAGGGMAALGSMHTKLMVLAFYARDIQEVSSSDIRIVDNANGNYRHLRMRSDGLVRLRVVVSTANFSDHDWYELAQVQWMQDFFPTTLYQPHPVNLISSTSAAHITPSSGGTQHASIVEDLQEAQSQDFRQSRCVADTTATMSTQSGRLDSGASGLTTDLYVSPLLGDFSMQFISVLRSFEIPSRIIETLTNDIDFSTAGVDLVASVPGDHGLGWTTAPFMPSQRIDTATAAFHRKRHRDEVSHATTHPIHDVSGQLLHAGASVELNPAANPLEALRRCPRPLVALDSRSELCQYGTMRLRTLRAYQNVMCAAAAAAASAANIGTSEATTSSHHRALRVPTIPSNPRATTLSGSEGTTAASDAREVLQPQGGLFTAELRSTSAWNQVVLGQSPAQLAAYAAKRLAPRPCPASCPIGEVRQQDGEDIVMQVSSVGTPLRNILHMHYASANGLDESECVAAEKRLSELAAMTRRDRKFASDSTDTSAQTSLYQRRSSTTASSGQTPISADSASEGHAARVQLESPVEIVFPTRQAVAESRLGFAASGHLCLTQRNTANAAFPHYAMRHYRVAPALAVRRGVLPHSKVMIPRPNPAPAIVDLTNDNSDSTDGSARNNLMDGFPLRSLNGNADTAFLVRPWCLTGSHNISSIAWGRRAGKGQHWEYLQLFAFELSVLFPPVLRLRLPTPALDHNRLGESVRPLVAADSSCAGMSPHLELSALQASYPWLRYFRIITHASPPPFSLPFENPPPRLRRGETPFVTEDAYAGLVPQVSLLHHS